jgi:hypothetical protein
MTRSPVAPWPLRLLGAGVALLLALAWGVRGVVRRRTR